MAKSSEAINYRTRYFSPKLFESAIQNKKETGDRERAFYGRWSVRDFLDGEFPQFGANIITKMLSSYGVGSTEFQVFSNDSQPGFFAMQASGFVPFTPENADVTFTWNVMKEKKRKIPRQEITITSVKKGRIISGVYESVDGGNDFTLLRVGVSKKEKDKAVVDEHTVIHLTDDNTAHNLGAITQRMKDMTHTQEMVVFDAESHYYQKTFRTLWYLPDRINEFIVHNVE
jgi:hypothetical protein